jgi:WhiB family transcriptional regulator, redox-sensing transcriptional regulator
VNGTGIKASSMSMSTAAAMPASVRRPDWRDNAACRDADPDVFFPDGDVRFAQAQVRTAKLICRECPVSVTCLSWVLASGHESGIWGGLTEDERRRLRWRVRGSAPTANSLSEEWS